MDCRTEVEVTPGRAYVRGEFTHRQVWWPQAGIISILLLLAGAVHPVVTAAAPSANMPKCVAPEYRQFDFWLGDWDVFDFGGKTKVAHVMVDRVLDGCAVREQYEDPDGMKGQSLSIYDATRKAWHQSWFTNRGELLVIEGKFQTGEMVLSGKDRTSTGEPRLVRGSWKPVQGEFGRQP